MIFAGNNYSFINYLRKEGNEDNGIFRLPHLIRSSDSAMELNYMC